MRKSLSALVAFIAVLGAGSVAMAATPATHHIVRHVSHTSSPPTASKPVAVMSEKPITNPSLDDVFSASDAPFNAPVVNDARTHGLPNL